MKMKPKISIIVTSFNIEKYIGQCLQNIIDQSIKEIEIIVVDDGSTDKTSDIILEYAGKDKRIIPILTGKNSPGGVATPANIGMNAANGDYIGFADGDDLYDPMMFEKLYFSAEEAGAEVTMCNFMEFENESGIKSSPFEPTWKSVSSFGVLDISSPENKKKVLELLPVPWRKLYNHKFIIENKLRFPIGDYFFEDNGFHWLTTLNARKISFIDEVLCYHRRNRNGQTMSANGENLLGVFHQHSVIYDYLNKKNLLSSYKIHSLNWLISHLSWVGQVIDKSYSADLYKKMIYHIGNYTKKEIRDYINKSNYSRKDIELVVSLIRKKESKFIEVMNGKVSTTVMEKLAFNNYKLGFLNFSLMLLRHATHKYTHRGNEIEEIKNIVLDSNHKINHLNHRINELERIIETGFILIENKVKK